MKKGALSSFVSYHMSPLCIQISERLNDEREEYEIEAEFNNYIPKETIK